MCLQIKGEVKAGVPESSSQRLTDAFIQKIDIVLEEYI